MSEQSTSNPMLDTVIDRSVEMARSPTVAGDDAADESRIDELQSSQANTPSQLSLEDLYPALKAVPRHWESALREIADLPEHNYIADGTDSESTRELCENIPRLLNTFVQTFSRATGAYIDAKAIWFNYEEPQKLRAYSTVTARVRDEQDVAQVQDDVASFAQMLCNAEGPFIERRSLLTYPLVYSTPEIMGRPLLPPPHANPKQRARVFDNFLLLYRMWQGKPDLPWATFAATLQMDAPAIAPTRYAAGLDWSLHVCDWPVEELDRAYSYQLYHQNRVALGDTTSMARAFQWVVEHVDEPYQLQPSTAPESPFSYCDGAAAYLLAMNRHSFPDDAYMQPSAEPRVWFTQDVMNSLADVMEPDVEQLIFWMEVNEKRNPPQRELQESDHPLFLLMNVGSTSIPEFVELFQVPKYVYDFTLAPHHDQYAIRALWVFVVQENRLSLPTGIAGGVNGVFRVVLVLLVIAKLMAATNSGRVTLGPSESSISRSYGDGKAIPLI
ncbi:hypothetical protein FRC11_012640, partial [Ceratobasidium sp. 423]